jgi:hypothetical protein
VRGLDDVRINNSVSDHRPSWQQIVRNKPVARASTGLIMFGRDLPARIAVVSVSELSPCPGRAAIEQLAPVYACVMGVCLQLAAYATW